MDIYDQLNKNQIMGIIDYFHLIMGLGNIKNVSKHGRRGTGTYRGPPAPTTQGYSSIFFDFLKAEVCLHEIYLAAEI